ncbi:hypothetical protein IGI04_032289 [Brassica rapa subsp. trilocularis]|uniref:Uncharacterized protein n=1 Tax=Brassica rapa subsp. trilocularis TaxID=1813537 RepID=A0ABQ7LYK1_BRACM|nr:hypothetical protein IGI04_032289 [Brassica rapa subsp. trilocularis]
MGRKTWFNDDGMKKGEWIAEEDEKLIAYINEHGMCDWRSIPKRAGLQRCGKSCRLRWLNYLRPGIKRGKFTPQEEEKIIKVHGVLGNRWAAIAKHMENRTDNDIKNHWNSCLKKRLSRNGIDPMTHELVNNNLTVTTTYVECGSSSTTTWPTRENHCSSTPSGLVCVLNKLAAGISSRQYDLNIIKNILLDPRITSSEQDEEEVLKRDQEIGGCEEEDFLIWDDEEVRRYMETDDIEYETTPYVSLLWATIAQQMPGRSDNDIKNHWNSCLKKRLERNGIDPMTHQPIINLDVKTQSFNTDFGSSSCSTASPSSSSFSSSSARLLNRIATGISCRQHGVDRIKNILSDPTITSINGEEEGFEQLKIDHGKMLASDDQEDDFLMWDEEKTRHFMEEIGAMDFHTNGVYNPSSSAQYSVYETGLLDDHLI